MLKPDLSIAAAEFLESLEPKRSRQVWARLARMCCDPYSGDCRKLVGFEFYRVKSGDYRIVFEVQGDTLNILLIDHRSDDEVYKTLRRLYG